MFDSGLGGLTVLRALVDLLPDESIVYFGDTGRFPYGPKPADEVLKYSLEIADLLVDRGVKLARGRVQQRDGRRARAPAATARRPGDRRDRARACAPRPRPPAPAGSASIGTVGTIASGAYQQRAQAQRDAGVELTCAACPGFVEFVEAGDVDSDQVHVLAERLLAPVRDAGVDTLVLGCTHYPLLARTIGDVMGRDVVLVSSADETAFAVRDAARRPDALRQRRVRGSGHAHTFVTTGDVATFREPRRPLPRSRGRARWRRGRWS